MPIYGPFEQKTFVENWLQALMGWTRYSNAPKHSSSNGILFVDPYPSNGQYLQPKIQCHKDYPMTLECEVKSAHAPFTASNGDTVSNQPYWNGLVLWPSESNYLCWIQKQYPLTTSSPFLSMFINESDVAYPEIQAYTEDTFVKMKIDYDKTRGSDKVRIYANDVLKGSYDRPLNGNAPPSLIDWATDSIVPAHNGAWYKQLTATGVIVAGLFSSWDSWKKNSFNWNNIQMTPFRSLTNKGMAEAVELRNSAGYREWDTDPLGTYETDGSCETVGFVAPNLDHWDALRWYATFDGGDIKVQVLDEKGELIPDSVIPGNSQKISLQDKTSIDLSSLDITVYPRPRFKVFLNTTDTTKSPRLYDFYATFYTTTNVLSFEKVPPQVLNFPENIQFAGSAVDVTYKIVDYGDTYLNAELKIYNGQGNLVKAFPVTEQYLSGVCGFTNTQKITWDGKNDSGQTVPYGTYYPVLEVTDSMGNTTSTQAALSISTPVMARNGSTLTITCTASRLALGEIPVFKYRTSGGPWVSIGQGTLTQVNGDLTTWEASMQLLNVTAEILAVVTRDSVEYPSAIADFQVTNVVLNQETANLTEGQSTQLSAVVVYEDNSTNEATSSLVWVSSDPAVVSVSTGGLITAGKAGSASISASNGTVQDSMVVTVQSPTVPGVPVIWGGFVWGGKPYATQLLPAAERIRAVIETTYEVVHLYSVKEQINTTYEVIHEYSVKIPIGLAYEVINEHSIKIPILTAYDVIGTASIPPDSKVMTITGTLQPGDEMVIDGKAMTAFLNGQNALHWVGGEGAFFALLAGTNEIVVEDESGSRVLTIEVTKRTKTL